MTPRQRRLEADFNSLKTEFSGHKYIKIAYESVTIGAPVKYYITYKDIKGYKQAEDSEAGNRKVEIITEHQAEIYLHADYPRIKPVCYMLTDIFHPNFRMSEPHDICIGDFWASGETLADIIYQIGDMIQYKNFSVKSPLNGVASRWAKENSRMIPADNIELRAAHFDIDMNNDDVDIEFK